MNLILPTLLLPIILSLTFYFHGQKNEGESIQILKKKKLFIIPIGTELRSGSANSCQQKINFIHEHLSGILLRVLPIIDVL